MCGKTNQKHTSAFTMVEMMMSMAVSGIILAALVAFVTYGSRSFAAMENYVDLEQKSQYALDTMTRNIRETQALRTYETMQFNGTTITNALTFLDSDNQILTYRFVNKVLIQTKGEVHTMLLTNVDYLCFQIFQRNTIANTYDQFPTAQSSLCKLISVSWICSRNILGSPVNTECVQTAKIVIRKQ